MFPFDLPENIGKKWVNVSSSHCLESVRIRSFFAPYFPAFGLNTERYGEIFPFLVAMSRLSISSRQIELGVSTVEELIEESPPFFLYLGFLSRTITNHRTTGEGGGHFFNFSKQLPPVSQTLRH